MGFRTAILSVLIGTAGTALVPPAVGADAATEHQMLERGRYVVMICGCNDCHTAGYMASGGNVEEQRWLTGDSFGWRGPWGTTYASNLRLFVKDLDEAQWIQAARTLRRRPPMPWYDLNVMSNDDLRAIYHYIRHLGDPGKPAPAFLPPGVEPPPPYASFPAPPAQP